MDIRIKTNKKCYVLIISRFFPKKHPKAGEHTHFLESIEIGLKIHTIRGNYALWKKRIDEVNAGNAYISRRYWSGEPYNSKQVEYDKLYKVEIQKAEFDGLNSVKIDDEFWFNNSTEVIAANDGLTYNDFKEWFRYHKKEPMAIIQFTDFKY